MYVVKKYQFWHPSCEWPHSAFKLHANKNNADKGSVDERGHWPLKDLKIVKMCLYHRLHFKDFFFLSFVMHPCCWVKHMGTILLSQQFPNRYLYFLSSNLQFVFSAKVWVMPSWRLWSWVREVFDLDDEPTSHPGSMSIPTLRRKM